MRALALAMLALLAGCNLDPVRPCQSNADCVGTTTPFDLATRCDADTHSCVRVNPAPADAGPPPEVPDAGPGDWTLTLDPPGHDVGAVVQLTATLELTGASYPFPPSLQGYAFAPFGRTERVSFHEVDGGSYAATWSPLQSGDYQLYVAYLGAPGHPHNVYSDLVSTRVDRNKP